MNQASYSIEVTVNSAQAQAQIAAIRNQLGGLSGAAGGASAATSGLSRGMQSLLGPLGSAIPSLSSFSSSLANIGGMARGAVGGISGMASGMGGLAAAGAAVAVALPIVALGAMAGKIFEATAAVQTMKASLTTVIGDVGQAGQAFDALAAFAAKTPFTLDQAVSGFTKLVALGLNPSERAMMSYGNTAAAMGKSLSDMIEAVADAGTGEFERLKEFGIKSKVQGDQVAFTFQGVTTQIGNNSQEIQDYLMKIGETQFAGGMDRQAKTLSGSLSTLSDTIFLMFAALGEGEAAEGMASAINMISEVITSDVQPALEGMMSFLIEAFSAGQTAIEPLREAILSLLPAGEEVGTLGEWIGVTFEAMGAVVGVVAAGIATSFQVAIDAVTVAVDFMRGTWEFFFGAADSGSKKTAANIIGDNNQIKFSWLDNVNGMIGAAKAFAQELPKIIGAALRGVGGVMGEIGGRIRRFFSGDFGAFEGVGAALSAILGRANSEIAASGKNVTDAFTVNRFESNGARLQRGDENRFDLGSVGGGGRSGGASPSGGGSRGGTSGVADKAANEAARAADAEAKALKQREEKLSDYITGLEKQATIKAESIGKTAEQIKIEENLAKARDMAGRDLITLESARITAATKQALHAEQMLKLEEVTTKAKKDAADESLNVLDKILYGDKLGVQIGEQRRAIEADIARLRAEGANSEADARQSALDRAQAALLAQSRASEIANKVSGLSERGKQFREENMSITEMRDDLSKTLGEIEASYKEQLASEGRSDAEKKLIEQAMNDAKVAAGLKFKEAVARAAANFEDSAFMIADGISQLFGQKAGNAAKGAAGLAGLFKSLEGAGTMSERLASAWGAIDNPQTGVGKVIKGFERMVPALGKTLSAGVSKALAGAGMGAEIGGQVAQVGKLFWDKFSNTGSQIGGAIGGAIFGPLGPLGPLGALGGSIIGGTIGGLLKKTPRADAKFGFTEDGQLQVANISGSKKYREQLASAGGDVVNRINSLAEQLGASLTSVQLASIGIRKDNFRVDTTGRGITKVSKGAQDFGKDQAAAVDAVVRDALRKGILTGMSNFSNRIVKLATDAALDVAVSYESVLKDLEEMNGGYESAMREISKTATDLITKMRDMGATSEELGNVQQWQAKKLEEILNEQIGGLRDFRKSLDGEGSGVTKLNRLIAAQAEFDAMKAKIDSGETVDNSRFTALGQEVFGLARDVYGTATSEFQAIRNELIGVTQGMINSAQSEYDRATAQAAQATATNTAIANDYLAQIAEAVRGGMVNPSMAPVAGGGGGSPQQTVNGRELWNGAHINLF